MRPLASTSFLLVLLVLCGGTTVEATAPAEQIHLSLTGVPGEVVITWATVLVDTPRSVVEYGLAPFQLNNVAKGSSVVFTDGGAQHLNRSIHNVKLTGLQLATNYFYHVGDPELGWSEMLVFRLPPWGNEVVTLAVYGDMGNANSRSMAFLQSAVARGEIDLVLHLGDFAYNMDDEDGNRGDAFMNDIQPIAATVPYMGCVGNHEVAYNFSHYTHRFSGFNFAAQHSGSPTNWYFSWEFMSGGALVHMAAISTEVYYNAPLRPQLESQYEWLRNDLLQARQRGVDWLIVYGHRPMYCSNVDDMPDCSIEAGMLRDGIDNSFGMERLLQEFGVDIFFSAHEHSYERTYPVMQGKFELHPNHTYTNPAKPVHIIAGAAGCQEEFDHFDPVFYGPWSVVRSETYGYGHLRVHNRTHLHWEQLLDEGRGGVDPLWIVRG